MNVIFYLSHHFFEHCAILAAALLLDAIFGEADFLWRRWPHPVVLLGRAIGWADRRWNRPDLSIAEQKFRGICVISALGFGVVIAGMAVSYLPGGRWWSLFVVAILLAQRSLIQHIAAIGDALDVSLSQARKEAAKIAGRDFSQVSSSGVARAAIESCGENFSDGVTAPCFWFLLAGLPGILLYKLVNTADSMIGHRSPRYLYFGQAAARMDDLMNWFPARLSGVLICLAGWSYPALALMWREARQHLSPNAGWPEAAMAACLGLALGGERSYEGRVVSGVWLNRQGRKAATAKDLRAAIAIINRAWLFLLAFFFLFFAGGIWLV